MASPTEHSLEAPEAPAVDHDDCERLRAEAEERARLAHPAVDADRLAVEIDAAFQLALGLARDERELARIFDAELTRAIEEHDVLGATDSVLPSSSAPAQLFASPFDPPTAPQQQPAAKANGAAAATPRPAAKGAAANGAAADSAAANGATADSAATNGAAADSVATNGAATNGASSRAAAEPAARPSAPVTKAPAKAAEARPATPAEPRAEAPTETAEKPAAQRRDRTASDRADTPAEDSQVPAAERRASDRADTPAETATKRRDGAADRDAAAGKPEPESWDVCVRATALRLDGRRSPADIQEMLGLDRKRYWYAVGGLLGYVDARLEKAPTSHVDRRALIRLAAGLQPAEKAFQLERHLRECSDCAAYFVSLVEATTTITQQAGEPAATLERIKAEGPAKRSEPVVEDVTDKPAKPAAKAPTKSAAARPTTSAAPISKPVADPAKPAVRKAEPAPAKASQPAARKPQPAAAKAPKPATPKPAEAEPTSHFDRIRINSNDLAKYSPAPRRIGDQSSTTARRVRRRIRSAATSSVRRRDGHGRGSSIARVGGALVAVVALVGASFAMGGALRGGGNDEAPSSATTAPAGTSKDRLADDGKAPAKRSSQPTSKRSAASSERSAPSSSRRARGAAPSRRPRTRESVESHLGATIPDGGPAQSTDGADSPFEPAPSGLNPG